MAKRILTGALAAAMLLSAAPVTGGAEAEISLAADPASGITVSGGEVEIAPGTSASALLACFENRSAITLKDASGEALSFTDAVASGATLSCGDDSATVIIPGDANGDAKINARDVVAAMRGILGQTDGFFASAADADHDGNLNAADVSAVMKYLVGWDVELGSAKRPAAANEDPEITMSFISPMLRVSRDDTSVRGDADGLVRMAKNELENAHLLISSPKEMKDLTLEVGELTGASGDVLTKEVRYGYYYDFAMFRDLNSKDYGNIIRGTWADPYPKLRGAFSIGENESQSFLVKITTGAETKPGWYSAPVVLKDAQGREIKRATLRVYVWDFALDEAPACKSLFECRSFNLASYFEVSDGATWVPIFEKEWYEYLLANKMSPQGLPFPITSSEVDKYLDDPRVTAFVSLGGRQAANFNDENFAGTAAQLQASYAKLSQKQEWLDKAYIYTVDEPYDVSGVEMVKQQWNGAKAALGDTPFRTIVPGGTGYLSEVGRDMFDLLQEYCNAFCPGAGVFTEYGTFAQRKENPERYPMWGEYMEERQFAKYGDFEPRYNKLRERGDPMWWYICVGPCYPYANFYNSYQGAWSRVVFWQQYRYNVDGFLYWDTCFWQVSDGDARKLNLKRTNGGDGLLMYPGSLWGEGMVPVPSIRMEAVRDGIEDFQYLRQLEAVLGREKVMGDYSSRVAKSMVQFTQDYNDIANVRDEMGFQLEALNNK